MSAIGQDAQPDVMIMRPFLPAKDWPASFEFYKELGFQGFQISDRFASMELGPFGFFLQDYYVKEWANNMMMQSGGRVCLDRDWRRISGISAGCVSPMLALNAGRA